MLNGRVMLLQILLVLFVVSAAFGQNVEVLKAELKGMEGRLDTKIDGVKDTLDAKIDGVKNELNANINGAKGELNANINGVKSGVTIIQWIIGGIGVVFTIFLGFLGYLLNYFVKQLLPNMVQRESRSTGQNETDQPQRELTGRDEFADSTEPDYQTAGGGSLMPDTHNPFEEEASPEAYLDKGDTFLIEARFEEAIEAYNNALSINPNYAEAYNRKGIVKRINGQYFEAIEDF